MSLQKKYIFSSDLYLSCQDILLYFYCPIGPKLSHESHKTGAHKQTNMEYFRRGPLFHLTLTSMGSEKN